MWIIALIGVVLLFFGLLLANYFYKQTNDYKNSRLDIKEYLKGVPENLKFVNVGSTYSKYAFDSYDDLNMNAFNFALQSESLEMDQKILRQYAKHIDTGGVVVVVVAACLLLFRESGDNLLYYEILDKEHNPQYHFGKKVERVIPLLFHPKKVKRLVRDEKLMNKIYDHYQTNMGDDESKKEMLELVEVWKKLFDLKDMKQTNFSSENIQVMKRNCEILGNILDFCKESKFRPIVVVPPFSKRLNCYFSEEFKEKVIRQNVRNITEKRNVLYLDYQDNPMFQDAPELFADGGFRLNQRGSLVFIRRLAFDLKKCGIEITNATVGKSSDL